MWFPQPAKVGRSQLEHVTRRHIPPRVSVRPAGTARRSEASSVLASEPERHRSQTSWGQPHITKKHDRPLIVLSSPMVHVAGVFAPLAWLLAALYAIWPSYGFAIAALTASVFIVLSPLTLHQAKAMVAMQRIQPELRQLRQQHKDDRQRLQQETLSLYQRHGVNPASGCLPMLVQLPVMIVMYRVIRGLTYHDPGSGALAPRYIDPASDLYRSLQDHGGRMVSWGIDLSTSALSPHTSNLAAVPFFALAGLVVVTSLWQQRVTIARTSRQSGSDRVPAQALMRVMPVFTGVFAVSLPAGVGVYYLVSNLFRVGQQHLLLRLHPPHDHDSELPALAPSHPVVLPGRGADSGAEGAVAPVRKRRAQERTRRGQRR